MHDNVTRVSCGYLYCSGMNNTPPGVLESLVSQVIWHRYLNTFSWLGLGVGSMIQANGQCIEGMQDSLWHLY